MDTGAMVTGACDISGDYLSGVFSSSCETTFGDGSGCGDPTFDCCVSEWNYSATVESCVSAHATASCTDYGFSNPGPASSFCSDLLAAATTDSGLTTTDAPHTTPTGTNTIPKTTATGIFPSSKSLILPSGSVATGSSKLPTSILVASSKANGTLATTIKSSLSETASSGSELSSAAAAATTTTGAGTTTSKAGASAGTSSTGSSASASATKSAAARGLGVSTSAAVGLFALLAVTMFRAGL